jgi:hypothetical protein
MPIRIDAEVICDRCGAKARCTLDAHVLHEHGFTVGAAIRGRPDWFFKDRGVTQSQHVAEPKIACSAECMTALAQDKPYGGDWKACQPDDVIGIEDVAP